MKTEDIIAGLGFLVILVILGVIARVIWLS